ncbi:hypothetical protein F5B21DRAFT_510059 [Xylaria acuta]|nr:hypothetical protein F5B21DRAFT_510059 [Xylaria acuta]
MSVVEKLEDDFRAVEAALMNLSGTNCLGQDVSPGSIHFWARLRHVLDLPRLGPGKIRDLREGTFNYLISNDLIDTAAALQKELADRASHHKQTETNQKSGTAGQTLVLLESHEYLRDGEQGPEVNKHSSQDGKGSSACRQKSTQSALQHPVVDFHQRLEVLEKFCERTVMPILSQPSVFGGRIVPEPEASTQEYAKVSVEPDSQSDARKVEDTASETESSASFYPDGNRPLLSPSTRALYQRPNEKKR